MAFQQGSSRLEQLPVELKQLIAEELELSSLIAITLTSSTLRQDGKRALSVYKDAFVSLCLKDGEPQLTLCQLLNVLLEDPWKSRYITRYIETYNGHNDTLRFDERSRGGYREEGDEENRNSHEYDSDDSEYEEEDRWDAESETYPGPRHRQAVKKLHQLIQTSPLVLDTMRSGLLEALATSSCHARLQGLLLLLCPNLADFRMEAGQTASMLLDLWPEGKARQMTCPERIYVSALGYQEICTDLDQVMSLPMLGGLTILELHNGHSERLVGLVNPHSTLRHLVFENCQIHPDALMAFLGLMQKPEDSAGAGLQSLVYYHGWGTMSVMDAQVEFLLPDLVSAIRSEAGASLEVLELGCSHKCWQLLHERDPESYGLEYNWDFSREENLRIGFAKLKEVILGPELLCSGWYAPTSTRRDRLMIPETVDEKVESLPLSILLPDTLEVLRLREFSTADLPLAIPIVLEKLVRHIEEDMGSTPRLKLLELRTGQLDGPPRELGERVERGMLRLSRACEAQGIVFVKRRETDRDLHSQFFPAPRLP